MNPFRLFLASAITLVSMSAVAAEFRCTGPTSESGNVIVETQKNQKLINVFFVKADGKRTGASYGFYGVHREDGLGLVARENYPLRYEADHYMYLSDAVNGVSRLTLRIARGIQWPDEDRYEYNVTCTDIP